MSLLPLPAPGGGAVAIGGAPGGGGGDDEEEDDDAAAAAADDDSADDAAPPPPPPFERRGPVWLRLGFEGENPDSDCVRVSGSMLALRVLAGFAEAYPAEARALVERTCRIRIP